MTKKISFSALSLIMIVVFGVFYTSCKKDEAEPTMVATSIEIVSGGDQTAIVETALTAPVIVIVKDQNGDAFTGATVKFETTDGSVSAATGTTDANGKAEVTWTLGSTVGNQILTVTALKADGTALTGSPITVNATGAKPLAIGDFYEGGVIFYLDGNGGGLVCAVQDQADGVAWSGNTSTLVTGAGATSETDGAANTKAIVLDNSEENKAATLCIAYRGGEFDDWFLPSKDELGLMYINLHKQDTPIGNFTNTYYWSSSEYGSDYAWNQFFSIGIQTSNYKYGASFVRAVRAF